MSIQRYGKWDFRAVGDEVVNRACAHYAGRTVTAEPERAAAVVLLREAPLRVYLLRHTGKEPFGSLPLNGESSDAVGGKDRDKALAVDIGRGSSKDRWGRGDYDLDRVLRRGGRYGFPGGRYKPDDPDVAMTGSREVEEETGAMVALQRAWARWVTPEYEPVRFDAWVYVATLAEGFQPRVRVREPDHAVWLGPEQAVCQYGGLMSMPEATTLAELSRYSTVGEVFAAAEQRDMSPILPRLRLDEGSPRLVLPGEDGYPAQMLARA
jgi:hypothetical protein